MTDLILISIYDECHWRALQGRADPGGWDVGEVSRNSPLAIGIPAGKPHLVISVKSHSEAAGRMNL